MVRGFIFECTIVSFSKIKHQRSFTFLLLLCIPVQRKDFEKIIVYNKCFILKPNFYLGYTLASLFAVTVLKEHTLV